MSKKHPSLVREKGKKSSYIYHDRYQVWKDLDTDWWSFMDITKEPREKMTNHRTLTDCLETIDTFHQWLLKQEAEEDDLWAS